MDDTNRKRSNRRSEDLGDAMVPDVDAAVPGRSSAFSSVSSVSFGLARGSDVNQAID